MLIRVTFLAFCCALVAANRDGCTVSDWGPFTAWSIPRNVPVPADHSWQTDSRPKFDSGSVARQWMMSHKEDLAAHRAECLQDGSCPERQPRQSAPASACVDGMAGIYPCQDVDLVGHISIADLTSPSAPGGAPGDRSGCDIWGWTDTDGTEYGIVTLSYGTSFVRLDPAAPEGAYIVAFMPTTLNAQGDLVNNGWRDAKVIGDFVFVGSELAGHGVQVYDLKGLQGFSNKNPGEDVPGVSPTTVYQGVGSTHNMVASPSSNTIFAVGSRTFDDSAYACGGGLYAIDVSNPYAPTYAGCFDADGYTHDAQCVVYNGPDLRYTDREVCFAFNEDTLTIVDVTDKANMVQISRTGYAGAQYTHQGWLTENQELLLLDDELDEYYGSVNRQTTHLWDVTDLQSPVKRGAYSAATQFIDHNQYVKGSLTYQANYEQGLRILSIDEASPSLTEVAYFDVHVGATVTDFFGMWSVYPYFNSGRVVSSSIEEGLFVLQPNMAAIERKVAAAEGAKAERRRFREILSADNIDSCPALEEIQQQ